MNSKIIEELINKLNLGIITEEPIRVFGGLLNRMYRVTTTKGIYAVKHLNPEVMKRKDAKDNHILSEKIANFAKENGINCIPAKIINETALQEINGDYFLIFDWFNGKSIKENEISFEQIEKVSELLAKLHNLDFKELKKQCIHDKEIVEINWDYYISKLENRKIIELLKANKDMLIELDKKSTTAANEIRNNIVVSHRDLDLPNILWDSYNNPYIIDWESAGIVNPCEELIETAWDWSGGQKYFDEEKFKYFIKNYKNNGGDISDYENAVYANFKNKSGWLEFNLKRACRIECFDNEEQKLGENECVRVIKEILLFYKIINGFNMQLEMQKKS